jgi:predicted nuclease of predicted toxin-antitoxin system
MIMARGHNVLLAPKGASDKEIGLIAKNEKRIILTHDSDFANATLFPPKKFYGIVLLKINPPILSSLSCAMKNLLKKLKSNNNYHGKLIILFEKDFFWIEE